MSKADIYNSTYIPTHSHTIEEVVGLEDALDLKADLDEDGKVLSSQIPDFAKIKRVPVADETARYALTSADIQPGDVAVQASPSSLWWLLDDDPSVAGSWEEINLPIMVPSSSDDISNDSGVNGGAGTVSDALDYLGTNKSDVGHTHPQSDITNLVSDLAALDTRLDDEEDYTADHEARIVALEADVIPSGSDQIDNDSTVDSGSGSVSDALEYLDSMKQAQDDALDEISALSQAKGSLIVHNGTQLVNQPVGTNNQVLIADSTDSKGIKWGSVPTHNHNASDINAGTLAVAQGGTNIGSYTVGDILYCSATNVLSKLAKGTDGQFLSLASGVPVWVDGGGGLKYVKTLSGSTSAFNTDTSIATSASLSAGTYLCRFYASAGVNSANVVKSCGYKVNSGSTIWVIGGGANAGDSNAQQAIEVTVTAGQTLNLRGYGGGQLIQFAMEIWGPI